MLSAEDVGIVYDDEGYQADEEAFETGVEVDDVAMSEEIVVPEDSVDSNSGSSSNMWMYIGGAVLLVVLIAVGAFIFKNRKDAAEFEH